MMMNSANSASDPYYVHYDAESMLSSNQIFALTNNQADMNLVSKLFNSSHSFVLFHMQSDL